MMIRHHPGFSLLEALVVLGLLAMAAACLMVACVKARECSMSAVCISNLSEWGVALQCYAVEHGGCLPRRGQGVQPLHLIDRQDDWFNALPPYLGEPPYMNRDVTQLPLGPGVRSGFVCPAAKAAPGCEHYFCYGMNMYLSRWDKPEPSRLQRLPSPSTLAFMADSPGGYASTLPSASRYSVASRHGGSANVLFVDGHVASFRGDYLGCGSGAKTHRDVRWQTLEDHDGWNPSP